VFYENFIAQHHIQTNVFQDYGANAIKKMGFSPDAFVQMTIQYAYRKMTGHFGATYESV
jgi:carnitine O-acetyltransferase